MAWTQLSRRAVLASAAALATPSLSAAAAPGFRVAASGLEAPEGPKPQADGSVLVCQMARGVVSRVMPDGTVRTVADVDGVPNGLAIGPDGAAYVCRNAGSRWTRVNGVMTITDAIVRPSKPAILRVDLKTGAFRELIGASTGAALKSPNDLVFDGKGGFWFSDIAAGVIYWARVDGSGLTAAATGVNQPNGVALSPDGATLYCSHQKEVVAFAIVGPGTLAAGADGQPAARVVGTISQGVFDSMSVEAGGAVVMGTIVRWPPPPTASGEKGALTTFLPDGSREQLELPDPLVTNVAFGGPDMKTAYATLSLTGQLVAIPWPRPGLKLAYS